MANQSREGSCRKDGCAEPIHAKQMCKRHYSAWYRRENPETALRYRERRRKTGPRPDNCQRCGNPIPVDYGNHHTRFCSRRCQKAGEKERARARGTHRKIVDLRCDHCGATYQGQRKPPGRKHERSFCSPACQYEDKAWRYRTVFSEPIRWACRIETRAWYIVRGQGGRVPRKTPKHSMSTKDRPRPRRWYAGNCADCGETFVTLQPEQRCCSSRCSKRLGKAKRRARRRQAYVEDVWRTKVYERDEWLCGICGDPIDKDAVVPEAEAATLDHIQPLALGGDHSYANVQAAHFLCNCIKSDDPTVSFKMVSVS